MRQERNPNRRNNRPKRILRLLDLEHAETDLRRTPAKLCHVSGGESEQIQFLLGHVSVLTTERYLGCKQNLEEPVNDRFGRLYFKAPVDLRCGLIAPTITPALVSSPLY
jgi:hypothetical protein